jgi:hypothetical protein
MGGDAPAPRLEFVLGPGVERAEHARPYERRKGDPLFRPLKVYARDPAESRLEGAVAAVNIPYEPLEKGPEGSLFRVVDEDEDGGRFAPVDLEDPRCLIQSGHDPSPSDFRFHQQMVYAVATLTYAAFRRALGRDLNWGFDRAGRRPGEPVKLVLRPHGMRDENAFYDSAAGEIRFGYFRAGQDAVGRTIPGGPVYTCTSHDIIVHEVTHALLDGLRPRFNIASNSDVGAFHEGFADLVAIFQHFSYADALEAALRESKGKIEEATILTNLATQFGHTTGRRKALRSAIILPEGKNGLGMGRGGYEPRLELHELGSILVSAVFDAFTTVYRRKIRGYLQLATNGTGILPQGDLPLALHRFLTDEASKLARQFLSVCIRAIDYCPPVDIDFSDYLRAMITADSDLVSDDPWGYREALVDAFLKRGIYPHSACHLSENDLLWREPERPIDPVPGLTFAELRFRGDPGRAAGAAELRRQALELGRLVTDPRHLDLFGLARPGDERLRGDRVLPAVVESVRTSRRAGPDGQVVFDLFGEVVQVRHVQPKNGSPAFDFYGGATVVVDPEGCVRLVVRKSLLSEARLDKQQRYIFGDGKGFWRRQGRQLVPRVLSFKAIHGSGGRGRPGQQQRSIDVRSR